MFGKRKERGTSEGSGITTEELLQSLISTARLSRQGYDEAFFARARDAVIQHRHREKGGAFRPDKAESDCVDQMIRDAIAAVQSRPRTD